MRRRASSKGTSFTTRRARTTYVVGEIRNGIGGDAQEAEIGERYSYKYREITKIENNAVRGNAYRLGEVCKHVCNASPQQID